MLIAHQLKVQGYKQYQIAEMLEVTDRTVRNYLRNPPRPRKKGHRKSKLEPYKPFINSILNNDPYYNCVILQERLQNQGYKGKISILRDYTAKVRKKIITEAVIRFETEPGRQAQVDWKEFRRIKADGSKEKVYAFVMTMGYSRKPFVLFTRSMKQSVLLYCHIAAFIYFGAVPHEILYDNMRTAFTPDPEGKWRPNKPLLAFANHYGFVPRRCRIRRPQTKGKVERTIGYLTVNFWPQVKDHVWEISALNEAVEKWCQHICGKVIRDFRETREERFKREVAHCIPLPCYHYDYREIREVYVNRESIITYQTNQYSVPPENIGNQLTLKVDPVNGTAEIHGEKGMLRAVTLETPGSRTKNIRKEDRAALIKLWEQQQKRKFLKHQSGKGRKDPEVDVRSPASYDKFSS